MTTLLTEKVKPNGAKPGGRVAAKDFDGGVFIVQPIDPYLTFRILSAVAKSLEEKPIEPKFDNFTGRKFAYSRNKKLYYR